MFSTTSGPNVRIWRSLLLCALAACALSVTAGGCGSDKEERGLTDFQEEATPESSEAMAEPEQERDQELDRELSEDQ